jgi:hypothetical protein
MNFLRDSIWQFILSLLGIVVAVLIYRLQQSKKSLSYQLLSDTTLLKKGEGIAGKVQVFFEEKIVEDAHLVVARISNDGNTPILDSDFREPFSLSFGKEAVILGTEVTNTVPKDLKPTLTVESGRVEMRPTLLNPGDSVTIAVLLSKCTKDTIDCAARIVGVKSVKRVSESLNQFVVPMIISVIFGILVFVVGFRNLSILIARFANVPIVNALATGSFALEVAVYSALILIGVVVTSLGLRETISSQKRSRKKV